MNLPAILCFWFSGFMIAISITSLSNRQYCHDNNGVVLKNSIGFYQDCVLPDEQ